jgi:hypothetical protein
VSSASSQFSAFLDRINGPTGVSSDMLKELTVVSGISVVLVITMSVLAIAFNVDVLILTAASLAIFLWMMVVLYRRSRRAAPAVPPACHVAAAIALVIGAGAVVGGAGHSAAVASLTLRESLYGPLQILRLTTGALLLFSGGMTLAMCPGIKAGRAGSVGVGAATSLLFWLYLLLTLPLPGTGGTVPPWFGMWSVYLLSLGAAGVSLGLRKSREAAVAR